VTESEEFVGRLSLASLLPQYLDACQDVGIQCEVVGLT
jgi:hypothetical protein